MFKKTRIYVEEPVIFNHHAKFQIDMSIFDPQKLNLFLQR